MTRQQATSIATTLLECGIHHRGTTRWASEYHGVSLARVRKIRRTMLRYGRGERMVESMVDAIAHGWEDDTLGLERQ